MWFKQISLFHFEPFNLDAETLAESLRQLAFTPCLPTLPASLGWTPPQEHDEAPIVYAAQNRLCFCLQTEEKILPATVVRQAVEARVKELEAQYDRKVRGKEKQSLRDEMTHTLLPQAFSKFARVHAYFDLDKQWLVVNTTSKPKLEQFVTFLKRVLPELNIHTPATKKPATAMTNWVLDPKQAGPFEVKQACTMQDPNQEKRVIRCQNQNLFSKNVQSFLQDGCRIKQLALSWQEQIDFVLNEDLSLTRLQYQDTLLEQSKEAHTETAAQQFDTDFIIMTETLKGLFEQLLEQMPAAVATPEMEAELEPA